MHKKMKTFVSVLAAAAMLVLLPGSNAMTANAEEVKTYSLKYIGGDINDWRYVPGNTFEDGMYHRELYYLKTEDLKDGDQIVVYSGDTAPGKDVDLSGFKLGNLTVHQNASIVIYTGGIKDCYVLSGAYTSINGDVTYANLYDNVTCNFNNNVLDMVLHVNGEVKPNIACVGTVGRFFVVDGAGNSKGLYYDIPNNTMRFVDGTVQFPNWAPAPTEAYLQAMAAADGTAAVPEATATPAPAGNASSEYDKVPKTGESNHAGWLIGLVGVAAVLFAGSYGLYRKTN